MGPISWSVTLHKCGVSCQGQKLKLIGPICKAWRQWIIVNIDFWDYIHNTSFLAPYKWAQQVGVLKWNRVEWFVRDEHSYLIEPIWKLWGKWIILNIQNNSFAAYKWTLWAGVLYYGRLEWLARDKESNLFRPFISYEENKVFWIRHLMLKLI